MAAALGERAAGVLPEAMMHALEHGLPVVAVPATYARADRQSWSGRSDAEPSWNAARRFWGTRSR